MEINNTNPSIYAYEDEKEIDKLIAEIELDEQEKLNQDAIAMLSSLLKM